MHTAQARQLQPTAGSNPMGLRKIETVPLHTSPLRSSSSCQLSSTSSKQGTSSPLLRSPRSPMTSASLSFLPSLFEIFCTTLFLYFPSAYLFFCLRKNLPYSSCLLPTHMAQLLSLAFLPAPHPQLSSIYKHVLFAFIKSISLML